MVGSLCPDRSHLERGSIPSVAQPTEDGHLFLSLVDREQLVPIMVWVLAFCSFGPSDPVLSGSGHG